MSEKKPTIKEKLSELDELVAWFESENFDLEQASEKLKVAARLASEIENELTNVENDIRHVKQSFAKEA